MCSCHPELDSGSQNLGILEYNKLPFDKVYVIKPNYLLFYLDTAQTLRPHIEKVIRAAARALLTTATRTAYGLRRQQVTATGAIV